MKLWISPQFARRTCCSLLGAALLFSMPAQAQSDSDQPRWFEIEVILFSNNVTLESTKERWNDSVAPVNFTGSGDLMSPLLFPQPCPTQESMTEQQQSELPAQSADCLSPEAIAALPTPDDIERLPAVIAAEEIPQTDQAPYTLTRDLLQLQDALARLRARGEYQPLLHTAWRQPVLGKRQAEPMRLFAGSNFTGQFEYNGNKVKPLASEIAETGDAFQQPPTSEDATGSIPDQQPPGAQHEPTSATGIEPAQAEVSELGEQAETGVVSAVDEQAVIEIEPPKPLINPDGSPNQVWQLDGLLRVYLEHYLYIESTMNLRRQGERERKLEHIVTEAAPQEDAADPMLSETMAAADQPSVDRAEVIPLQEFSGAGSLVAENDKEPYLFAYHFDQFRRVRSNELHYFDHPLVGMLIQIRPYEVRPEPEPELIETQLPDGEQQPAQPVETQVEPAQPEDQTQPSQAAVQ